MRAGKIKFDETQTHKRTAKIIPFKHRQIFKVRFEVRSNAFYNTITSNIKPSSVVLDNEKAFLSAEIRGMMQDLKIKIITTPSSHSESNGQTERLHSTITELTEFRRN